MKSIELMGMIFAMGLVILFCRVFPFLFLSREKNEDAEASEDFSQEIPEKSFSGKKAFFVFVEKIVPPAAMTVLAFNALASSLRDNPGNGLLVLGASIFTALIHLWKHNTLLSILGGTALYMILQRTIL